MDAFRLKSATKPNLVFWLEEKSILESGYKFTGEKDIMLKFKQPLGQGIVTVHKQRHFGHKKRNRNIIFSPYNAVLSISNRIYKDERSVCENLFDELT